MLQIKHLKYREDYNRPDTTALRYDFCQITYSADLSDYWSADPEAPLNCAACREPLQLVTIETTYKLLDI